MNNDSEPQRLDQIETQWSLLRLAHEPISVSNSQARQRVILKYNRAIRDYVGALLHDECDADEVAQDVLIKLLQGNFAGADPSKGRFRDFLKVAVKNMVRSHWAKKQRRAESSLDVSVLGDTPEESATGPDLTWQTALLDLAMRGLERFEQSHVGCLYHTVLKLRADLPDATAQDLAASVASKTGRPCTNEQFRQQLRRARLRFAQLLVEEVAASLQTPTPDNVEQELVDLKLMEYVRPFLPDDWRETGILKGEADL